MLYSIKNREDLETLEEFASSKNQVEELRIQDKLGKQKFRENVRRLDELLTDTTTNTSENITKTITEASNKNNKAISDLNEKFLELNNDNGMTAPYFASFLVDLFKPENVSRFKLIKNQNSIRMNDFLINTSIPVTLYSSMFTFRESIKTFKLDEDLLKTMTHYSLIVDDSNSQDRTILYDFGKEMKFKIKQVGRKNLRDGSPMNLLKSPAIMVLGISTVF